MTDGLATISIAMQTRFFYPPEMPFKNKPPTYVPWHF
jgi:hypothetical protein